MPRLTEQEQQEIIRYLEADKPLPDKYRFLLFADKREVELVWNGKTSEVSSVVLPFQVIEQVDEPRAETPSNSPLSGGEQLSLFTTDSRGRQLKGWTNKLIWGDNKLILSSLKNGPLREEIEKQGGLKLVYIDPPFDVGADFTMDIEIGDETFTKKPSILEEIAYRDTWGRGADSFIAMIYERLVLMRDLLAEDGFIVIHMGDKVASLVRLATAEVFGEDNYRNTIIIPRGIKNVQSQFRDIRGLSVGHDVLIFFSKSEDSRVKKLSLPGAESSPGKWDTFWRGTDRPTMRYELFGIQPSSGQWRWSRGRAEQAKRNFEEYLLVASGNSLDDYYVDNLEQANDLDFIRLGPNNAVQYYVPPRDYKLASTLWASIRTRGTATNYATEKNEELLSVVIDWLSSPRDLVADFFCGSGTTAAVAERLGRKWIVSDLGKFAIHITRKRMIGVQRELKAQGKDYRAFEILNLGKYERQHYIGVNPNLRQAEQQKQLEEKEAAFVDLILRAYRAEKTDGFATFHGKKSGRLVAVGPVNLPVTRLFVEEVILECLQKHITRVDILGFEFEMGLFPNILDEARAKGIDIAPKYIPAEVFDKRAVDKNQVVFHDVSFIEVKPHFTPLSSPLTKGGARGVAVELTDFSVFYSQDSIAAAEATLKDKGSKIVVEQGQIIKVSKDGRGFISREVLTNKWTDWVDYWAVDFNFESKREIIRVKKQPEGQVSLSGLEPPQLRLEEYEEVWTGDYVFENEWQSFRTRKDRSLEIISVFHECPPGRRKIAVKVVDIFGTDTMTIVEVQV